MPHRRFRLGDWFVDPGANRLSRGPAVVRVRPRVMDLLLFLASNAGRVVSHQEVARSVWAGEIATESVLSGTLAELRAALSDSAKAPRVVETVPRRGYRLVAAVQWLEGAPADVGPGLQTGGRGPAEGELGPGPKTDSPAAPHPAPPLRLVNRDDEIAALEGWLDIAGRGRAVTGFVTGEAGAGKSTLLTEFARRATARRVNLLVARGQASASTGAGAACSPFADILRQLTGEPPAAVVPQDLTDPVARVLTSLSARHTVLLLLDDMHHAGEPAASLLFHLARHLGAARILIVAAYRPSELTARPDGSGHPLARVVSELARDLGPCEIRVRPQRR